MIKLICYLFAISVMITSCTDATSTTTNSGADSIKKETAQDTDVYNEEQEIKNMISEMTNICEVAFTKDTTFIIGADTFTVTLNHSCTGDSFLLPAKYIETYKLPRFMAHNLKTDIVIEKDGVSILDKRIIKKDFESVADQSLNQYAVLLYPILKQTGDSIYIDYSLSIPLTDVGIAVRATILKDGGMYFGKR
jgi:hypothetical protein